MARADRTGNPHATPMGLASVPHHRTVFHQASEKTVRSSIRSRKALLSPHLRLVRCAGRSWRSVTAAYCVVPRAVQPGVRQGPVLLGSHRCARRAWRRFLSPASGPVKGDSPRAPLPRQDYSSSRRSRPIPCPGLGSPLKASWARHQPRIGTVHKELGRRARLAAVEGTGACARQRRPNKMTATGPLNRKAL